MEYTIEKINNDSTSYFSCIKASQLIQSFYK